MKLTRKDVENEDKIVSIDAMHPLPPLPNVPPWILIDITSFDYPHPINPGVRFRAL